MTAGGAIQTRASTYRRGFNLSEGPSAKLDFRCEIEKLRAEIFIHVEKTKTMLDGEGKFLI
jgi:hypothetical protein